MIGIAKLALLSAAVFGIVFAHPFVSKEKDKPDSISGRYIVTLKDGLDASAIEQHIRRITNLNGRNGSPVSQVEKRWNIGSWNAYCCTLSNDTLAQVSSDDAVQIVELDGTFSLTKHITQKNSTWGLATISHRKPNFMDYVYDAKAGEGTYAYILDTGLLTTHEEFGGRAFLGHNVVGGEFVDALGHGTHVAGTIGGATYGVAKKTNLISVKIFGQEDGRVSDFLEGFNWAVNNITEEKRQEMSVISVSATAQTRESINRAVEEAYRQGVLTVAAAGNFNRDAKYWSPGSAPNAVTVGSIGRSHSRSAFSNWGELVDIFAPGEDVKSAWIGNNQDAGIHSGTSMATPHISGLILYLKSIIPYRMKTPASSVHELMKLATNGDVRDAMGSANLIGFNGNGVVIFADD